jgi:hypothetical protein
VSGPGKTHRLRVAYDSVSRIGPIQQVEIFVDVGHATSSTRAELVLLTGSGWLTSSPFIAWESRAGSRSGAVDSTRSTPRELRRCAGR